MSLVNPKKIKHKECRFVTYVPAPNWDRPDLHVSKEIIHYEDGTTEPALHFDYDYIRPIWVTRKGFQNHKQHKEWEDLDRVIELKTTQGKLIQTAARALRMFSEPQFMRKLFESPYIYGADIKSTAVKKKDYINKYPDVEISKFSVGAFDIETDVVRGTKEIIMASLTFKEKVFSVMLKSVVDGMVGWKAKIDQIMEDKLSNVVLYKGTKDEVTVDLIRTRNLQCEVILVDNELDLIKAIFEKAHAWKFDFMDIWNMDFEVTKILEVCEKYQYDPKYLFSDPSVPDDYKYFNYKQGPSQKKTSSGKFMPIKPAARWHTVSAPAHFYVADGMCAYKHTRAGEQEEQSYGLDAILRKEFNIGKMIFKGLPATIDQENHTLEWHKYMQKNHPLEYLVYNRFDCISLEMLDEKVMDLSVLMPKFSGTSDFEDFKSQPRRVVDKLHWFGLERGRVIGVTSSKLVDEHDEHTLDRADWVITLPAPLVDDNSLRIFDDSDIHSGNIYSMVGDLDVSASYPNGETSYNIGKDTTSREIVEIEGIDEEVFRMQNMHLSAGHVNAIEYCTTMMGFPKLDELLTAFDQKK